MRATSSMPTPPRLLCKALTALMVAAAWGALGYGLEFSTPNIQYWHDLEAGGRFGINLLYYLPYLMLSLPLAAVLIAGFLPQPDRMFPLAGAMGLTALFTLWVLANDQLLAAQPELDTYASAGLAFNAAGTLPLLTAHYFKHRRAPP